MVPGGAGGLDEPVPLPQKDEGGQAVPLEVGDDQVLLPVPVEVDRLDVQEMVLDASGIRVYGSSSFPFTR